MEIFFSKQLPTWQRLKSRDWLLVALWSIRDLWCKRAQMSDFHPIFTSAVLLVTLSHTTCCVSCEWTPNICRGRKQTIIRIFFFFFAKLLEIWFKFATHVDGIMASVPLLSKPPHPLQLCSANRRRDGRGWKTWMWVVVRVWSRTGLEKSRCTQAADLSWRSTENAHINATADTTLTLPVSTHTHTHTQSHLCEWRILTHSFGSFAAIRRYGKDFSAIAEVIGTKTPAQVRILKNLQTSSLILTSV